MSNQSTVESWPVPGVKVEVPGQNSVTGIRIDEKPWVAPCQASGFEVKRPLVNFAVVDLSGSPLSGFDPPMMITVCRLQSDAGWELAYWKNNSWNQMKIRSVDCPFNGFMGAVLTFVDFIWDDPAMAWGTFTDGAD